MGVTMAGSIETARTSIGTISLAGTATEACHSTTDMRTAMTRGEGTLETTVRPTPYARVATDQPITVTTSGTARKTITGTCIETVSEPGTTRAIETSVVRDDQTARGS